MTDNSDFKFNFPKPDGFVEKQCEERNIKPNLKKCVDWCVTVSEIIPVMDENHIKEAEKMALTIHIGSSDIKHLTSVTALKIQNSKGKSSNILLSETTESDLVPGIYEGGFKIWECSLDLAKFIDSENIFAMKLKVLELGCGCGLPGLVAYLNDCQVTFQDFNAEVLEMLTIPNVYLNTPDNNKSLISNMCTFISGHWHDIKEKLYGNSKTEAKKFDVILTSETIYDKNNQYYLLELMKSALHQNGKIYLAAKTHYFGVGGTLDNFISLVKEDGTFESKIVQDIQEGIQRKIIMLQFLSRNLRH